MDKSVYAIASKHINIVSTTVYRANFDSYVDSSKFSVDIQDKEGLSPMFLIKMMFQDGQELFIAIIVCKYKLFSIHLFMLWV